MTKELQREILWMKFKIITGLDTSSKTAGYLRVLELALPRVVGGDFIEGTTHVLGQLEVAEGAKLVTRADELAESISDDDASRMVHRYMKVIRDIEALIKGGTIADSDVMKLLTAHSPGARIPAGGIPTGMARQALRRTLKQKHDLYGKVIIRLLQRN